MAVGEPLGSEAPTLKRSCGLDGIDDGNDL
jgi:hypothetical protein